MKALLAAHAKAMRMWVIGAVILCQQWQIHELKLDHQDAGEYIDEVADMVGDCGDHDSCGEWLAYLEEDIRELNASR